MMFSKTRLKLSGAEVVVWALAAGPALGAFYFAFFTALSATECFRPSIIFDVMVVFVFLLPFVYAFGAVPALVSAVLYWKFAANVPYAALRFVLSASVGFVTGFVFFFVALGGLNDRGGLMDALQFAVTAALPESISLALIFEGRGGTPDRAASR